MKAFYRLPEGESIGGLYAFPCSIVGTNEEAKTLTLSYTPEGDDAQPVVFENITIGTEPGTCSLLPEPTDPVKTSETSTAGQGGGS